MVLHTQYTVANSANGAADSSMLLSATSDIAGHLQERSELECSFDERLADAKASASRRYDALKVQLEARLGSLAAKLADLAATESKRERHRAELEQQASRAWQAIVNALAWRMAGLVLSSCQVLAVACSALVECVQVDALRVVGEEEGKRRATLERTLREAASLFKKELWGKAEEVAELQVCIETAPPFRMNC
jgi:hypothetical protein